MKGLVSRANILGRIGGLAGIYGVDLSALHEALGALGPELARTTTITVPITFDRIAIATRVARDRLAELVDREQLWRLAKVAPEAPHVELELEADDAGAARTVRAPGRRSLETTRDLLGGFGVGTLALDSLRDCAADLGSTDALSDRAGPRDASWRVHFSRSNRTDEERATTRAQLVAVARKLGATAPQCNLVDGLHAMLAKDRDSYALLSVSPDETSLSLAVGWQQVRWDTAIRMALGFRPGPNDVGARLGELSGAFDAEQAASLELLLGPREPPGMRVSVTFAA